QPLISFSITKSGAIHMKSTIVCFCTLILGTVTFSPIGSAQSHKAKVDLIVAGATVVTMDPTRRILDDGAIAVSGDSIEAVGSRAEIEAKYSATQRIDARGKLVLPGFI